MSVGPQRSDSNKTARIRICATCQRPPTVGTCKQHKSYQGQRATRTRISIECVSGCPGQVVVCNTMQTALNEWNRKQTERFNARIKCDPAFAQALREAEQKQADSNSGDTHE